MRRGQQGLTLIGFIIVLIVLGLFAYVAMIIIPMYSEYYAIKKALVGVVHEPGIEAQTPYKIGDMISRHFEVSYVSSVEPKDIKIKRMQNGLSLTADYRVEKQIGNSSIYVMGHFVDTETTPSGTPAKGE